jgi:hypothetical protein
MAVEKSSRAMVVGFGGGGDSGMALGVAGVGYGDGELE